MCLSLSNEILRLIIKKRLDVCGQSMRHGVTFGGAETVCPMVVARVLRISIKLLLNSVTSVNLKHENMKHVFFFHTNKQL